MTADGSDRSFGAPRFDVVLRGYDRRQVDEHLSRLNRVLARMRSDLESARGSAPAPQAGTPPPAGVRPRPTPRPRTEGFPAVEGDVVGTFTERMQTILQAAEEEASEIRAQARSAARAEEERLVATRAALTNLVRQRDAVLADLTRMRGQLEALLSGPTARITVPAQDSATAAAARRDAGAGQPLPGTAAGPAEDATRSVEVGGAPDRVEGGTAVLRPPREPRTDAGDEATAQPGERTVFAPPPAVERPPGGSPAERTALMSPPDTGAEHPENDQGAPPPADATVKVAAVGRHEQAGSEPDAGGGDEGREPTETEHASASRPG